MSTGEPKVRKDKYIKNNLMLPEETLVISPNRVQTPKA
jgi:hypothetical protein